MPILYTEMCEICWYVVDNCANNTQMAANFREWVVQREKWLINRRDGVASIHQPFPANNSLFVDLSGHYRSIRVFALLADATLFHLCSIRVMLALITNGFSEAPAKGEDELPGV